MKFDSNTWSLVYENILYESICLRLVKNRANGVCIQSRLSPLNRKHADGSPLGCELIEATNKVLRTLSVTLYSCQNLKLVIRSPLSKFRPVLHVVFVVIAFDINGHIFDYTL